MKAYLKVPSIILSIASTALLVDAFLLSPPAHADRWCDHDICFSIQTSGKEARLFDPKRQPKSDGRLVYKYAEGTLGSPYELKLTNNSGRRRLACIAIDGKNVIDGKSIPGKAIFKRDTWGKCYVIEVHDDLSIDGWRESLRDVREFVFTYPAESLAYTMDHDGSGIGTIIVAFFDEEEQSHWHGGGWGYSPNWRNSPEGELATKPGDRRESPAHPVEFNSSPVAFRVLAARYAEEAWLQKKGIWTPENTACDDFGRFCTEPEKGFVFGREH